MRFARNAEHGVVFAVIVFDGTNQSPIAVSELLIGRLHGDREVITSQIDNADVGLHAGALWTPTNGGVFIESL